MSQPQHERASAVPERVDPIDHNPLGERACQVLDRTVKEMRRAHGQRPGESRPTLMPHASQQGALGEAPALRLGE